MSLFEEIVEGHFNEFRSIIGTENKDDAKVFKSREKLCVNCPMKLGNTCNRNMYIHPKTKKTSTTPKAGFIKGCGCRLSAKQRSPQSNCPAGFWGGEFKNQ